MQRACVATSLTAVMATGFAAAYSHGAGVWSSHLLVRYFLGLHQARSLQTFFEGGKEFFS